MKSSLMHGSLALALVLAACKGEAPEKASAISPAEVSPAESKQAGPVEDLSFSALEKRVALNELRKEVSADRAGWPREDVSGLDFTKETGNAIIVHHESGRHSNPIGGGLTGAPPFKLFHMLGVSGRTTVSN